MITKRDVVKMVIDNHPPPYVPWAFKFTQNAGKKLEAHWGKENFEEKLGNHILFLGDDYGFYEPMGNDCYKDYFGATWDRSIDKDIGNVKDSILASPEDLDTYTFPDPLSDRIFGDMEEKIAAYPDRYRLFQIGFSLFFFSLTLRGMENLLMDFILNPDFVRKLFQKIADYNISQVKKAVTYNIDAIYFGDDWGQQRGLIMGSQWWGEFIKPELKRMYDAVRDAGKAVFIHSCGDVDELFDDLVDIGLNCFNPFQPEVMDIQKIIRVYKGRLSFWGGLSTQKILPYGSPEDVRKESQRLIELGCDGNFIFAPAHNIQGDVSLENMLAAIETVQAQSQEFKCLQ